MFIDVNIIKRLELLIIINVQCYFKFVNLIIFNRFNNY